MLDMEARDHHASHVLVVSFNEVFPVAFGVHFVGNLAKLRQNLNGQVAHLDDVLWLRVLEVDFSLEYGFKTFLGVELVELLVEKSPVSI